MENAFLTTFLAGTRVSGDPGAPAPASHLFLINSELINSRH